MPIGTKKYLAIQLSNVRRSNLMSKSTDIRPVSAELYFIPVKVRVPLKFGAETLTSVVCARVKLGVEDKSGNQSFGWGETPLSVPWVWPSELSFEYRETALKDFCIKLAKAWSEFNCFGHPMEVGDDFQREILSGLLKDFNAAIKSPIPYLGALVCCSPFDIALHDGYGNLHNIPIYETYNEKYMNRDLSSFMAPVEKSNISFKGQYPCDYFPASIPEKLPVWHLVGGKDCIIEGDLTGTEPGDGYPVLLQDWILRDGLNCLKVKLRGNDEIWDYQRLVDVGRIAAKHDLSWLSADFNCMVHEPDYVNRILDKLLWEEPAIYGKILYVEQPFPYELGENKIDVHSVSARKPLFMDESAHDWHLIKLGRALGWT
ncbi:MAG: hypothetical protein WCP55_10880, partial [Lentisphaerota bacterium]